MTAKLPDYKGKLTIYNENYEEVGEIIAYISPNTNDRSPDLYGQISLNKPITIANFGMWKQTDTGSKCPRYNAPKKPKYKLCYKCNLLTPTPTEAKQP